MGYSVAPRSARNSAGEGGGLAEGSSTGFRQRRKVDLSEPDDPKMLMKSPAAVSEHATKPKIVHDGLRVLGRQCVGYVGLALQLDVGAGAGQRNCVRSSAQCQR